MSKKSKMKAIVVNFFAGPGAGKSTTASALFTLLKLHSVECEVAPEFAKDLVWEERAHTFGNQYYIFAKQQHRVWRVADKVDVVITDSPMLLSNIYRRELTSDIFKSMVLEEFNNYNNLNFFINRGENYVEAGRNETEDQARIVDNAIKKYLSKHSIYYHPIDSSLSGINIALNTVLSELGITSSIEIKIK